MNLPAKRATGVLGRNGLTLALLGLFLLSLAGQVVTGFIDSNDERAARGDALLGAPEYLADGHFWEALGENWESEFLQMLAFVWLTTFLYQRGSPESKDPEKTETVDRDPAKRKPSPRAPWPVRRGGLVLRLYEHSLGLAFLALFLSSFAIHAVGGFDLYNDERRAEGQSEVGLLEYVGSARFWFESFQNWQSEFLSVAAMVYLSVYLRERGSAESKPVDAPHAAHE